MCGEPEMDVLSVTNPEEQVLKKIRNDPTNVPLSEALQIVRTIAHKTGSETVLIDESEGRILSEPIHTSSDLPVLPVQSNQENIFPEIMTISRRMN